MYSNLSAAESLEGMILNNRWRVIKRIIPKKNSTGGYFSVCYEVEDNNKKAFLKALNFSSFFNLANGNIVDSIKQMTDSYTYERDLLYRCRDNSLSKVSIVIDEGVVKVPDFEIISNVPFLVFDMAEGDIRNTIDFTNDIDYAWKIKSLHNICVGLKQLHGVRIGHQDLKPSNILLFENSMVSKIGDLGRSLCQDIQAPHHGDKFVGDINYSPPEYLYGYIESDWNTKVKTTDFYLFGSMVTFYFTGVNMTTLLLKNTPKDFKFQNWGADYQSVLPYLKDVFQNAIEEFKRAVNDDLLKEDLAKIVNYCCNPDPNERGHKSLNLKTKLDFEKTISNLDLIYRKLIYKVEK